MRLPVTLALASLAVPALAGCGGTSAPRPAAATTTARPTTARPSAHPAFRPARCPAGLAGCRVITGRILVTQRRDPDGDGSLHLLLAAGGISLPGLTWVDVAAARRPAREPGIGDLASAAGPLKTGGANTRELDARVLRVRPLRRGG